MINFHISIIFPLITKVDAKTHKSLPGEIRSPAFQSVCNGKIKRFGISEPEINVNKNAKCHLVHHFTPYLLLGPFKLDVKLYHPFRTIIQDFFTEKEMVWMMEYSKPRLSASRRGTIPASTRERTKSDRRYADPTKKGFTVGKAVTTWFNDIEFNEEQQYIKVSPEGSSPNVYEHPPLKDPYSYRIEFEVMHGISKRIELATALNVTDRHAASRYQTTNYGLSGMVVDHTDPWGYEQGVDIPDDRSQLSRTGDYIATFMGWFEDTKAGGGTAFVQEDYEGVIEPTRGSAAFWINLSSAHYKDHRAKHGGCPVLQGSKWILNKWMYSWDQWKRWPCRLPKYTAIPPFEGMTF